MKVRVCFAYWGIFANFCFFDYLEEERETDSASQSTDVASFRLTLLYLSVRSFYPFYFLMYLFSTWGFSERLDSMKNLTFFLIGSFRVPMFSTGGFNNRKGFLLHFFAIRYRKPLSVVFVFRSQHYQRITCWLVFY